MGMWIVETREVTRDDRDREGRIEESVVGREEGRERTEDSRENIEKRG